MNRKIITLTVLGVVLSALLVSMFRIPKVSGTITIQPDGTIDPPTASITTADNILYTFTGNVNDSIVIQRDGIILDGLGYNLTGSGTGYGIELNNRNNVTIQNIVISNFSSGIVLRSSADCNVTGNEIVACPTAGVVIRDTSHHMDVRGNTIVNSSNALRIFDSTFINITGNLLTSFDYGVYFYQSSNCSVVDNQIICERADDKYGVYIRNSYDNIVFHNNITEAQAGIYIYYSSRNSIQNNSITSCGSGQDGGGVWIYNGDLNTIHGNHISENRWHGINLYRSPNTTITENLIDDNSNRGIMLRDQSDFSQVIDNDIISNYYGIEVDGTHHTIIDKNNLTDNQYHGITLEYSSNNTISSNYVSGNSPGVSIGNIGYNNLTGNTIINNGWGLSFGSTSHNYLADNYVAHNLIGITLQQTWNNTLRNNTLTNNTHNFRLLSSSLQNFINDVDESNTVEGKPIYYWIDKHDTTVPLDAGCVILVNCSNMTIQNLNISCNNWQGVFLIQT
ncbi:MAG: right-handed parallel beta-helix repeat-containing protein, partial [Candidatus Bathyarchaeota archaeon]